MYTIPPLPSPSLSPLFTIYINTLELLPKLQLCFENVTSLLVHPFQGEVFNVFTKGYMSGP